MSAHMYKKESHQIQTEEFLPKSAYALFDPMIFPNTSYTKKKSRKEKKTK